MARSRCSAISRAEAVLVDVQALLGRHLEGQVDREPVGVVQLERRVARQPPLAAAAGLLDRDVEDLRARTQGLAERLLLGVGDLADPVEGALELGVGLRQPGLGDRHQHRQRRLVDAEQPHRVDRAAQQPPQHVAAALVARRDPVGDQHHAAAHVVGDHPHPHVVLVLGAVAAAGQLLGGADHRADLVDLVHVVDALQQVGDPLETHAGVDVLVRQLTEDREALLARPLAPDVLHEHEVPELHVAVAGLPVPVGAERGAPVDEDLRARAARPGHAHGPVVVLHAEPDDAVVGQAGHPLPQLDRLVVVEVDAGVQLGLVEAEPALGLRLGDQVPAELDGAFLEVVAEREVAAHLEEGAVPGGLAHLLDVQRAHALLHARGALPRRRLLAEEVGLERHHAGVDEQQVGVVVEQ